MLGHIPAEPNKGTLTLSRLTEPFPSMTILKMESVPFSFHHPRASPFSFLVHGCRALSGANVISGGVILGDGGLETSSSLSWDSQSVCQ